ncbi:hypothetical protein DXV75_07625 [Alteromonas aestuariivivens]|uniref:Uncharacterized protein n=1 Tax=Alteromonas aestuariivivens TaxID=1938339 RepID=A0A3D8MAG9_9ALTE|nr:hypothetical protein DXV75_07625 [Alteromonas aestuariivivens]
MLGLLIVVFLCVLSSILGFFLGKLKKKLFLLFALIPFIFVTLICIYELYLTDSGGGSPFVIVLFFTVAAPVTISYLIFFSVGFKRKKNNSKY